MGELGAARPAERPKFRPDFGLGDPAKCPFNSRSEMYNKLYMVSKHVQQPRDVQWVHSSGVGRPAPRGGKEGAGKAGGHVKIVSNIATERVEDGDGRLATSFYAIVMYVFVVSRRGRAPPSPFSLSLALGPSSSSRTSNQSFRRRHGALIRIGGGACRQCG